MTNSPAKQVLVVGWALSATVLVMAVLVWGRGFAWQWDVLSTLVVFPLLGLVAFSLMWVHYVVGVMRYRWGIDKSELRGYFGVTGAVVLVALLLHPGLLVWQLWRDGLGLPPWSYLRYIGPALGWVLILATICWLVFLAFELGRWLRNRRWWWVVDAATDVAMVGIFVHALLLGTQIHGWYRGVWWFYGVTLILALIYIYYHKAKRAGALVQSRPS